MERALKEGVENVSETWGVVRWIEVIERGEIPHEHKLHEFCCR
jgi:flavin-binding protein dodecin